MIEIDVIVARNFLIAVLIGALVGLEREKMHKATHEVSFGGLRTFILFAQAGAVGAWLSLHFNTPWVFIAVLAAVSAAVLTGYILESRVNPDSLGLTTEIAAITVCLLGGAVMAGYPEGAVALAILTSSVLAFKQPLHGLVAKLGTDDLYAGLKLLIATFIVLPLLPSTPIDPWGALNPYRLWLLVILISMLSLVGYVAVRWLGTARGTAITGIAGGLASSTAVSLSMARQSRIESGAVAANAFAAGILFSWTVMFVRVVLTIFIVYRDLVAHVLIPFGVMALAATAAGVFFFQQHRALSRAAEPMPEIEIKNPFSLTAASQFGALFAAVLLLVKLAEAYAPATGVYVVSAIAGLTDVDAITLSMSDFARGGGAPTTAAAAIAIATVSNTLVKCGFVVTLGSAPMRRRMVPATAAILALGLGSLYFV
jgi:uncharacterized membrane protein (DUF4010 family)